jgi:hypothetical protein
VKKIFCQACRGNPEDTGCRSCNGYGVVLETYFCDRCKREWWARPGMKTTMYDGRSWQSFDGLDLIYRLDGGLLCKDCDRGRDV